MDLEDDREGNWVQGDLRGDSKYSKNISIQIRVSMNKLLYIPEALSHDG